MKSNVSYQELGTYYKIIIQIRTLRCRDYSGYSQNSILLGLLGIFVICRLTVVAGNLRTRHLVRHIYLPPNPIVLIIF